LEKVHLEAVALASSSSNQQTLALANKQPHNKLALEVLSLTTFFSLIHHLVIHFFLFNLGFGATPNTTSAFGQPAQQASAFGGGLNAPATGKNN
jgi:hypothetical protein